MKAANEVGKDHICRIIFLNLVVDEQKVADYHLTKAFTKLEKMQSFRAGRQSHILLELFKYITENPEPSELLLEQLKTSRPAKSVLVEGLVF